MDSITHSFRQGWAGGTAFATVVQSIPVVRMPLFFPHRIATARTLFQFVPFCFCPRPRILESASCEGHRIAVCVAETNRNLLPGSPAPRPHDGDCYFHCFTRVKEFFHFSIVLFA